MSSSDWSNLEEMVGILIAIATSLFTLVFVLMGVMWRSMSNLDDKIDESEEQSKQFAIDGDKALWKSLNDRDQTDRQFRERMIERVSSLPTKQDVQLMEQRLTSAIQTSAVQVLPAKV